MSIKKQSKNKQLKLHLQWNKVSLVDKNEKRPILENLSGEIRSGQFVTIMGPSGAGKSSFLSILTAKTSTFPSSFKMTGSATINGVRYSREQFTSISSYVQQDDILMQNLSIRQTLLFQAKLKLFNFLQFQIEQRVDEVLRQLNLLEVQNSYIGGKLTKCISGGQKKRVAIGIQLISNPACLILDQPTSGLDSFNSLKIIQILANLAKNSNKLIIATIHQPSTLMYLKFDKLLILKNGRQVFFDQAKLIVPYMEQIGIKVDQRMNPCDFFMLQLSAYKQQKGYVTQLNSQNFEIYHQKKLKARKQIVLEEGQQKVSFKKQQTIALIHQFKPLFTRSFKNFYRNPVNIFTKLSQMIIFPFFIGLLFFDVIQNIPPLYQVQKVALFLLNFAAFMFIGLFFSVGQTIYDTVLVCINFFILVPAQRQLIMKEVHSNMYSLNLYYIAKLIIQIPSFVIPIVSSTTIVYFAAGLEQDLGTYLFFSTFLLILVFIYSLQGFAGYLLGIFVGILLKDANVAIQVVPLIITPLIMFGGLPVNLNTMADYASWMQYFDPVQYGYKALLLNQLNTDSLLHLGQYQVVKDLVGISDTQEYNLTLLILLIYTLFVFTFLALYIRRKL